MPGVRLHVFCPDGLAQSTRISLDGAEIPRVTRATSVIEAGSVARVSLTLAAPVIDVEVPPEQATVTIPLGLQSVTIPLDRLLRWAKDGVPE